MAGILTVDTIQSDSSYASTLNVASKVNFTSGMQIGGADASFGGMRNRIINGAMSIAQYGTSTTMALGGNIGYACDRFRCDSSVGTAITAAQSTSVVPTGFAYSLSYTAGTGTTAAGDNAEIVHFIEGYNIADLGWGTANAQPVTLSFWARSSLTGSFGLILENSDASAQYLTTYSLPVVNTWTKITLSIPAPTIGTWLSTKDRGIGIRWDMGVGTTNSGASTNAWNSVGASSKVGVTGTVKITQNTGATFYITGVQLEKGSTATSFDFRPHGMELALCQRYFERSYNIGSATGSFTNGFIGFNTPINSASDVPSNILYKVTKRDTPTIVVYNAVSGASGAAYRASDAASISVTGINYVGTNGVGQFTLASASINNYLIHYTASSEF